MIDPDAEPTPFARRCAIEFNAAWFILHAAHYAKEQEQTMTTTQTPRYEVHTDREDGYVIGYGVWDTHERQYVQRDWVNGKGWNLSSAEHLARVLNAKIPCHYCDNTNANADGLCPTCQAREERDAATYDPPCPHCNDYYEHGTNFKECPANPDNYDGPIPSENAGSGFNRYGIMVLAVLLSLFTAQPASAQRFTDYPIIGTPAYNASCTITREWEDHSAIAYCSEDGATYAFDADGNGLAGLSYNPGWQWSEVWEVK
jgi:hypothetical protein